MFIDLDNCIKFVIGFHEEYIDDKFSFITEVINEGQLYYCELIESFNIASNTLHLKLKITGSINNSDNKNGEEIILNASPYKDQFYRPNYIHQSEDEDDSYIRTLLLTVDDYEKYEKVVPLLLNKNEDTLNKILYNICNECTVETISEIIKID